MRIPEIRRGLQSAGFTNLSFVLPTIQRRPMAGCGARFVNNADENKVNSEHIGNPQA